MTCEPNECVEVYQRIAALEAATGGYWKSMQGQALLWFLTWLSGVVTVLIVEWIKRKFGNRYSRDTLVLLLGDEILFRWEAKLAEDFRMEFAAVPSRLTATGSDLGHVKAIAETVIAAEDLTTFRRWAEKPPDIDVLKNPLLVSEVVYAHVLFRDLVDGHTLLVRELASYDLARSSEALASLADSWETVSRVFKRVDDQIAKVWMEIAVEYERVVRNGLPSDVSTKADGVHASMQAMRDLRKKGSK